MPFLTAFPELALVGVLSSGLGACAEASAEPGLRCAEPTIDFGDVWEGSLLEHEFVFEVHGADIVVNTVRADCGCTVAELEVADGPGAPRRAYVKGDSIPAGASLFVGVDYNTRGKRGAVPQKVSLFGSMPGGRADVSVGANIRSWLSVEPEQIDIEELFVEDRTVAVFRVASPDGTPFGLRHTGLAIPPQVEVTLVALDPETGDDGDDVRSSAWQVTAVLGPGLPTGTRSYPLQLVSDVENSAAPARSDGAARAPHAAIPMISVRVVGHVSVHPTQMSFGVVNGTEAVSRTVRLETYDSRTELSEPAVRLLPLRSGEEFPLGTTAQITTTRAPDGNGWDVQLLFPTLDDAVQRTFLARLVIDTGVPAKPTLEVPVTGFRMAAEAPGGGGP